MSSDYAIRFYQLTDKLWSYPNISQNLIISIQSYIDVLYDVDLQEEYSKPMPWIGMYIVLASLVCILAMVADLLHGLKSRKLWFPCNYFTLNAASLSVIAVAIKLPMDLNNSMPGEVDQAAKLGSMAFMCIMMVNSLPSLAGMDNKQLVTNIVALGVLVITLVVNVCIQINTGVVSDPKIRRFLDPSSPSFSYAFIDQNQLFATIYVAMLVVLLIIYTCSALAIMESKRILESKYQTAHQIALKDQELQQSGTSTVEKLKQHMSKYWIMAGTGSPQFMTVCSATTSASGVICALSTVIISIIMLSTFAKLYVYYSDYEWSVPVIFVTQSIGVILGTIAPLCRCFASLSFKVSIKWIWDHIKVFKVESYWTQKLCDLKQSSIAFQFRSHKCKIAIEVSKLTILIFCIGLQKTVVVACKMIALIPILCSALFIVLLNKSENRPQNKDLTQYVLSFQDDMEPAERILKRILQSMNRTIRNAEKQQPTYLKNLVEKSRKGVDDVPPLVPVLDCWSLELVTLTTIARSLPNIPDNKVTNLLKSVSEGLKYVILVDECLDATHEHVGIQKAAKFLWLEVECHHKWLGKRVKDLASLVNTARQILQRFKDTSENILTEAKCINIESTNESTFCRFICAKAMCRITQRILLSYQDNSEEVSGEKLFDQLSSMISDTMAACLTNLPRVIEMKCQTNVIEKREAGVHVAAQLLGETTEIINLLQDHELPCLSSDTHTSEAILSLEESVSHL